MKRTAASMLSCAICAAQAMRSRSARGRHATAEVICSSPVSWRRARVRTLALDRSLLARAVSRRRCGVLRAGGFRDRARVGDPDRREPGRESTRWRYRSEHWPALTPSQLVIHRRYCPRASALNLNLRLVSQTVVVRGPRHAAILRHPRRCPRVVVPSRNWKRRLASPRLLPAALAPGRTTTAPAPPKARKARRCAGGSGARCRRSARKGALRCERRLVRLE